MKPEIDYLTFEDIQHTIRVFKADVYLRGHSTDAVIEPKTDGRFAIAVCDCGFGCVGLDHSEALQFLQKSYKSSTRFYQRKVNLPPADPLLVELSKSLRLAMHEHDRTIKTATVDIPPDTLEHIYDIGGSNA